MMRRHTVRLMALAIVILGFSTVFGSRAISQTHIVVSVDQAKDTISRFIYGNFSEHLGRCIYGGFYVGDTNTTIPNTHGIRNDVVQALRKIKIPVLRWPGGCFADTYHWMDGIGPKEKRPVIVNTWWGGVTENNSFGSDEFMDLCHQLGAEPYISGNVGSGTVQELSQWVQYMNFAVASPMSEYRVRNGHVAPYNVRFWGVGNEAWGCGGNMTAEHYADVYRTYATFMQGTGNAPIFRVASGASSDDFHWTEVMMRDIPHHLLEGVALHHYSVIDWNKKGSATEFTEKEYFTTLQRALPMEQLINRHAAIMDKYDPQKKIALVVDEWGGWYDVEPGTNGAFLYQQNTMRDAMIAGATLNIFNNRCDRVRMANIAQAVNVLQAVILTEGAKILLTPTYHVMEMYTVHHDALMLPVQVDKAPYVLGGDTLQAISASASRDKDGIIHVSLVNVDARNSRDVVLEFPREKFSKVTGRVLASKAIQDHNTFEHPDLVTPKIFSDMKLDGGTITVRMPSCAVVVLALR